MLYDRKTRADHLEPSHATQTTHVAKTTRVEDTNAVRMRARRNTQKVRSTTPIMHQQPRPAHHKQQKHPPPFYLRQLRPQRPSSHNNSNLAAHPRKRFFSLLLRETCSVRLLFSHVIDSTYNNSLRHVYLQQCSRSSLAR